MKGCLKYIFLFAAGGLLYNILELAFRGWSHWTMFFLGGLCFAVLGAINEVLSWETPLWLQAFMGAVIVTALEFATGCVVNRLLGWGVWDYTGSQRRKNCGDICPRIFPGMPL